MAQSHIIVELFIPSRSIHIIIHHRHILPGKRSPVETTVIFAGFGIVIALLIFFEFGFRCLHIDIHTAVDLAFILCTGHFISISHFRETSPTLWRVHQIKIPIRWTLIYDHFTMVRHRRLSYFPLFRSQDDHTIRSFHTIDSSRTVLHHRQRFNIVHVQIIELTGIFNHSIDHI